MILDWGNVLVFHDEHEYYETLGLLCKDEELVRVYTEKNKNSGAWGNQGRMLVKVGDIQGLPRALEVAFATSTDGRISETKYVTNLHDNHCFTREVDPTGKGHTKYLYKTSLEDVRNQASDKYKKDFDRGLEWDCDFTLMIRRRNPDEFNAENETVIETESGDIEGRKVAIYTTKYERSARNRKEAIRIHGTKCMICGFDFEEVYGELGKGFIEVHHIKPISELEGEVKVDPGTDLICVCSNCHRMLHRYRDEIVTVEKLREVLMY